MASSAAPDSPSLSDQAYGLLEDQLVTLALPPGSMISEGQLIELTGLGRTPVREAMLRLAEQKLFRVLPRRGLLVTPLNRTDIQHVLEARKSLERVIVYRAALNARDEQRSNISSIARAMSITHDSFEDFLRLERELDDLLDACAGNPFASSAVAPMRSHCRRLRYYFRRRVQLAETISVHSQMARLVARRDYTGAQKAVDGVIAVMERLASSIERGT
jgi:DNA-binding GntR family transcriptional regulator